jgi:hypothetical protein
VEHPLFSGIIIFAILLNTVLLALDQYDVCLHANPVVFVSQACSVQMSPGLADFLDDANIVLTLIFAGEMCIKLAAFGPNGALAIVPCVRPCVAAVYVSDPFNCFDGIIVILR